jgi:hypothetical protein
MRNRTYKGIYSSQLINMVTSEREIKLRSEDSTDTIRQMILGDFNDIFLKLEHPGNYLIG